MKQKKIMNLWQFILLLLLSVVILATAFLPAYHIDSDALKKGMENAQIEEDFYKNDKARDKDIKKYTKKFDKELKREKKENGTDNKSISTLKLMTSSLTDICYNGKYDADYAKSDMGKKTYDALNKKHKMTRVLLWLVYGLALAVILTTILGYGLKLNKYVPLANNVAYGIFATMAFAILQFATISGVKKETGKLTKQLIDMKLNNIDSDKIAPSFLAVAFLVGMSVAAVFLLVSIVSMFVGGQAEADMGEQEYADDWNSGWDQGWNASGMEDMMATKGAGYSGDVQGVSPFDEPVQAFNESGQPQPQPQEPPQQEMSSLEKTVPLQHMEVPPQEPVKKPAAKNGKVRCTKGETSGVPGYALPQDRKVIVGKSPHQANLVIINNARVSNIHCSIRYNAEANAYRIKDHSTNGTFVNGARLPREQMVEYPAGTVLSLADGSVEITLG